MDPPGGAPTDLDGRFIFYWIALGALYGRPKYLQSDPDRTPEGCDIQVFMKIVSLLDKEGVGLRLIGGLHRQVDALVRDNFLSNHCWRQWHRHKVVRGSERATCCVEPPDPRPVLLTSNSHFPPLDHPPRSRGSTRGTCELGGIGKKRRRPGL